MKKSLFAIALLSSFSQFSFADDVSPSERLAFEITQGHDPAWKGQIATLIGKAGLIASTTESTYTKECHPDAASGAPRLTPGTVQTGTIVSVTPLRATSSGTVFEVSADISHLDAITTVVDDAGCTIDMPETHGTAFKTTILLKKGETKDLSSGRSEYRIRVKRL